MPLVTLVAKGKTWDDETFNQTLAEWDVKFYEAEAAVLRPLVQGDGLLQLMQKNLPEARAQALLNKLDTIASRTLRPATAFGASPKAAGLARFIRRALCQNVQI